MRHLNSLSKILRYGTFNSESDRSLRERRVKFLPMNTQTAKESVARYVAVYFAGSTVKNSSLGGTASGLELSLATTPNRGAAGRSRS